MDHVKELTRIVTRKKLERVEVIGKTDSHLDRLYNLFADRPGLTDEDAVLQIYGTSADKPRYQRLKSRLKRRLLSALFLIDVKARDYGSMEEAYYSCWRDWATVRILLGREANRTALSMAEKVLRYARRYDFTDLALMVCRVLRTQVSTVEGHRSRFDYYNRMYREYEEIFRAESLAEEYYQRLMVQVVDRKCSNPDLCREAELYMREIQPLLDRYDAIRLHRFGRMIGIIGNMHCYRYEETIRLCEEAITFFSTKPVFSRAVLSSFYYQQIACCIHLRRYGQGQAILERALALQTEGSFNWFKNRELNIQLALHTRRYQEAYEIYLDAVRRPAFRRLDELTRESWTIYEAYLCYLLLTDRVRRRPDDRVFGKFRPGRFINQLAHMCHDKRGMNIHIRIIPILFNIARRRYDPAVDCIEAVEKYASRYLRSPDTVRSHCFLKMLVQIPISGFHRMGVERRAARFRRRLENMPLELAKQGHEIEAIPYEHLWEMALDSLDRQFHWTRNYGPVGSRPPVQD